MEHTLRDELDEDQRVRIGRPRIERGSRILNDINSQIRIMDFRRSRSSRSWPRWACCSMAFCRCSARCSAGWVSGASWTTGWGGGLGLDKILVGVSKKTGGKESGGLLGGLSGAWMEGPECSSCRYCRGTRSGNRGGRVMYGRRG